MAMTTHEEYLVIGIGQAPALYRHPSPTMSFVAVAIAREEFRIGLVDIGDVDLDQILVHNVTPDVSVIPQVDSFIDLFLTSGGSCREDRRSRRRDIDRTNVVHDIDIEIDISLKFYISIVVVPEILRGRRRMLSVEIHR